VTRHYASNWAAMDLILSGKSILFLGRSNYTTVCTGRSLREVRKNMCGVAGIVSLTSSTIMHGQRMSTALERLRHRGPDEEGIYINHGKTACLGHRRLRIIDLETGQQPLTNEDGTVVISFNGEIYDFVGLKEQLERKGHIFRTKTDTEVIVHLFEDRGISCLDALKGMFVFAIWDDRSGTLFLARDRIGKKPVYYASHAGMFGFASELPALLALLDLPRELDEIALDYYFTLGYIPAPRTIYQGVQKLEAGTCLTLREGRQDLHRYWMPECRPGLDLTWDEAKHELERQLRNAVARRLVSDVPLGCFLSGGVDSSAVLAFMAEETSGPVKTFSIGFPDRDFDELKYARMVAHRYGTDHHEYVVEPDTVSILDKVVERLGEPFADSSALPTWYLSELTRKEVTVALTGDGGDELFGGYDWYETAQRLSRIAITPRTMLDALSRAGDRVGTGMVRKIGRAARLAAMDPARRYAAQRQIIREEVKRLVYSRDYADRTAAAAVDWLAHHYEAQPDACHPLNRMMAADLGTYMPDDLLVKVDRMSMAHSLECRCPLLDVDLVEWVLALPLAYKVKGSERKRLFKAVLRRRLPAAFFERPKQGFSMPLARWFRQELSRVVHERVLDGSSLISGLFNIGGIRLVLRQHLTGEADHSATIWALLVFSTWFDKVHQPTAP
jgi:asparagine synthase (glutamine-hydrolysing)